MSTQLGTAVNFGLVTAQGFALTSPTFSGHFGQSINQGKSSDVAQVRNGLGDVINETFYDVRDEAEIRVVIGSATNIADAQSKTTLGTFPPGTIVNISTCAARPDLVATNWVVTESGPRIEGGNTEAASLILPIRKRAGITAVSA